MEVFLLSRFDLLSEIRLKEERSRDSVSSGLLLLGVSCDISEATATSRKFSMGSVSLM